MPTIIPEEVELLNFFGEHIEFFSAPFLRLNEFSAWLKIDKSSAAIYKALNSKFLQLLSDRDKIEYSVAITGGVLHPTISEFIVRQQDGLVHGDDDGLLKFLKNSLKVRIFLFDNKKTLETFILFHFIFKYWNFFSEFFTNEDELENWLKENRYGDISYILLVNEMLQLLYSLKKEESKASVTTMSDNYLHFKKHLEKK